jgi:hypothetical protein
MEISNDGTEIAYTGMTTVEPTSGFTGYYHPIVGVIDLDLNSQWSLAYNFDEKRTSGVDVEYNSNDDLFVLLNCQDSPWSIMEVDGANGTVIQQPVNYEFNTLYNSKTRAHKLHCTDDGLVITGNCFVDDNPLSINPVREQLLFHYKIADPTALTTGSNTFNSYSRDIVPAGSQETVTGYWAPENSIVQGDYTSIVGIYNDETNYLYGYTLIQLRGWMNNATDCLEEGDAERDQVTTSTVEIGTDMEECMPYDIDILNQDDDPEIIKECSISKSLRADVDNITDIWQYISMDKTGVYAALITDAEAVYHIEVYDIMGRKVASEIYNVEAGSKEVYIKFEVNPIMYIINVTDGLSTKTLKVMGK